MVADEFVMIMKTASNDGNKRPCHVSDDRIAGTDTPNYEQHQNPLIYPIKHAHLFASLFLPVTDWKEINVQIILNLKVQGI